MTAAFTSSFYSSLKFSAALTHVRLSCACFRARAEKPIANKEILRKKMLQHSADIENICSKKI